MRWKLPLILGIFLLLCLGFIFLFARPSVNSSKKYLKVGDSLSYETIFEGDKKNISLKDFRGKVLLLNFWASWCDPCIEEMPSIDKLNRALQTKGFSVIAVNVDKNFAPALKILEKAIGALSFPLVSGNNSQIMDDIKIFGIPHTVIVDRNGVIRYSEGGARNWARSSARKLVEDLL